TAVAEVTRHDVVSANANLDREAVLRLAEERGLRVIAVTDDDGRLVGRISAAELTEISRAEAAEDLLKLGGVSPASTTRDGPVKIVRRRVPWLLAGLAGASVAAGVIGSFEDQLARAAVLASFIPVIMATAGNAGIQASTVTLQGLTAGEDAFEELVPRLGREFLGALMNGAMIGLAMAALVIAASVVFSIDRPGLLAATVAVSLLLVTALASTVGAAIPAILDRLGLDPATATGIFITTANDVFGVLAFFYVASLLYL
ncbi:MAG: magnesium transporter, partial [Pseudomonadota bacterium]